ncbi:hypothetical protein ACQW5G_05155 [Fructilactobacillus sp. Tb1]|uniref:hypothetical protein n=1 Tax=Fructilactobacillus sp. Tb1 TaxID=3422304 RepID=UPI003D2958D6
MKFLELGKKEVNAINKWRAREERTNQLHRLMHLGKETTLKLTEHQINLFMQIKLKY